jgi:hypothetical protein
MHEKLADRLVVCISRKKIGRADAVASPIDSKVLRTLKKKRKYALGKDTIIEGWF